MQLNCVSFSTLVSIVGSSPRFPGSTSRRRMRAMDEYRVMLCANMDGCPYTEKEFADFFGGAGLHLEHWRNAEPAVVYHRMGPRCRWLFPQSQVRRSILKFTVGDIRARFLRKTTRRTSTPQQLLQYLTSSLANDVGNARRLIQ